MVTLAGHSGEQSQQEVVKSALNRFIKESENLTLSDEEDGLFQSSDVIECSASRCFGKFMLLSDEDYRLRSWATTTDHLFHVF